MIECVVCGNKDNFNLKFDNLSECIKCNHIFYSKNMSFDEITKIYSDDYFFGDEYINYLDERKQIEKNTKLRINTISKYVKNLKNKNLYEIGCAYGFFLNASKNIFKSLNGIDVNTNAINFAFNKLKLKLDKGDFLNKNIQDNYYDIFCMFDVIEHLSRPDLFIEKIHNISKKNSYLIITTGDIKSINARIKGKKWRLIHPPSHIHYFSKKTITRLLEKNNFKVININHCGYYRSFNFIYNKIPFFYKYLSWISKNKKISKILNLDIYLNLFDIMFVIAKKND